MIIYCGLRHFYIHHFEAPQPDTYYILTYNRQVWDFSPELKDFGFNSQTNPKAILHLDKPVLNISIDLADFRPFASDWHNFTRQYTEELEPEHPHAWYARFQQKTILQQFVADFEKLAQAKLNGGIYGGGNSKIVAKLAAHNLTGSARLIQADQIQNFLNQVPLQRFPLPETGDLMRLGFKTLGELADLSSAELSSHFGKRGEALQQLGRGVDLFPFSAQQIAKSTWQLDCTTLEGFLRPLTPSELDPFITRGLKKISCDLQNRNKVAGALNLASRTAGGKSVEKSRRFKQPTNDYSALQRAVDSLLPQQPLALLHITATELQTATTTQLNMFAEPIALQFMRQELPAQKGVELPRREKLLLLWEEHFNYE